MTCDLDNLIKSLSENYTKCSIEKQTSPSYVRFYTNKTQEVVLVYLKSKPNTYSEFKRSSGQDNKDDFELTGSPLKLDLSLHTLLDETMPSEESPMWSKEEASHTPISLKLASEIANKYNSILRQQITDENNVLPMWIVVSPTPENPTMLLMVQSYKDHFSRAIVKYEGSEVLDDIDVMSLVESYAKEENIAAELVSSEITCKYVLSGVSYTNVTGVTEELVNAPFSSYSELVCGWTGQTVHVPVMSCKVMFEQEVIIGHLMSPCNSIWRSLTALHNLNQILVNMTVAGINSVSLETAVVRRNIICSKNYDNTKRINRLLNEVETYAYNAQCPTGGCLCVSEDTTSLKQCLQDLESDGSSNDFTYRLWDILKDCDTAEELTTLLIHTLKFISSGKIRPFIDANNKTYLSKLVLKLSRGHSQTSKVLKNLSTNPAQALSLVSQVGVEKTMWEYTKIMSLIEHSFFVAGIWNSDNRSTETVEQINQTIQDMTMSGDFTLNPFESLSNTVEQSIRLDSESFYDDDLKDLSVDEFASLKKHGLVGDKKTQNEVPLIADEIDITPWKNLLMKFAQVHVCLEHLYRAELCLRADFANLKPLASRLLDLYVSERSPVKTIGQLLNEPVQRISIPISNNIVRDHLKKPVYWYRAEIKQKDKQVELKRSKEVVYIFSQQPVFPPAVWQGIEPPTEDVQETTTYGEELKYHITKYTSVSNRLPNIMNL